MLRHYDLIMVATRFAVAAHIMLLLAEAGLGGSGGGEAIGQPATSSRLAAIVNTNPVVVRRITGQLARAGLVRVHRGPGGAVLARPADEITLDDIWAAIHAGAPRPLVPLHARSVAAGERGRAAHDALAGAFGDAEAAFRAALARITLRELAPARVSESA